MTASWQIVGKLFTGSSIYKVDYRIQVLPSISIILKVPLNRSV